MSLDVRLKAVRVTEVFEANITHNLGEMAQEAGIYYALWRPEEIGIVKAGELINPLTVGLELLKADPERYKKLNPENGWGNYDNLINFVTKYLESCEANPDALVEACR